MHAAGRYLGYNLFFNFTQIQQLSPQSTIHKTSLECPGPETPIIYLHVPQITIHVPCTSCLKVVKASCVSVLLSVTDKEHFGKYMYYK